MQYDGHAEPLGQVQLGRERPALDVHVHIRPHAVKADLPQGGALPDIGQHVSHREAVRLPGVQAAAGQAVFSPQRQDLGGGFGVRAAEQRAHAPAGGQLVGAVVMGVGVDQHGLASSPRMLSCSLWRSSPWLYSQSRVR